MKKVLCICLLVGLVIFVKYCSVLQPPYPPHIEDNGLYYAKTEQGYIFYSVNNYPLFDEQIMDSYQKIKKGTFQISGKQGFFLYQPQEDCLIGPYINIKTNSKGFLVEDVNGWGMLNSKLECIIPTEHSESEISRFLN